jgi:hypothetical protein
MSDVAGIDSPVDAVAPWLLRVGIDHSGTLDPTQLWDIGIRGAVLADLWLAGRITDGAESLEIDTESTGIRYLDIAIDELVDGGSEPQWIARGRLRVSDVAAELVAAGEWTRRWSFTSSRWHLYRSRAVQQHVPLRKRLAHTYDGDTAPVSAAEAAVALLGHALNVVRPRRIGKSRARFTESPLDPQACGAGASVVQATIDAITSLSAAVNVNSNPAW